VHQRNLGYNFTVKKPPCDENEWEDELVGWSSRQCLRDGFAPPGFISFDHPTHPVSYTHEDSFFDCGLKLIEHLRDWFAYRQHVTLFYL
jgi:hypothetical protein